MAQKRVRFEGKIYVVPEDATMDEIAAAIGTAMPAKPDNSAILKQQAEKYPSQQEREQRGLPSGGVGSAIASSISEEMQPLIGAAKGPGGIVEAGGQWLQDLPRQARERISGMQLPSQVTAGRPSLQPSNPGQRAGQMLAGIGAGAGLTAATAGASLPAQIAAGSIGGGLIAAGTGGDPKSAAIMGAAGPVVQRGLDTAVPMLRRGAQETVASVLNPRKMESKKAVERVIADVTKTKPFAWSSEGLLKQYIQKADDVNAQIDNAIDAFGGAKVADTKVIASKLLNSIDDLKIDGKLVTPENKEAAKQLGQVMSEIKSLGKNASLESLRKLKQAYQRTVEGARQEFWRTLPYESRGAAAMEGFNKLRDGLIDAVPDLKPLGREYQKAATVRDMLRLNETRNIAGTQSPVGRMSEIALASGSVVTGNIKPVQIAATMKVIDKFLKSTPARLGSANLRTSLANAAERGDFNQVMAIAAQITAQALGQ